LGLPKIYTVDNETGWVFCRKIYFVDNSKFHMAVARDGAIFIALFVSTAFTVTVSDRMIVYVSRNIRKWEIPKIPKRLHQNMTHVSEDAIFIGLCVSTACTLTVSFKKMYVLAVKRENECCPKIPRKL
jgi:hypothetical protein